MKKYTISGGLVLNGETGSFKVGYNANTTSFEEVSQSEIFREPVLPDKKGYEKK